MTIDERMAALEERLAAAEARIAVLEAKPGWPHVIGPLPPVHTDFPAIGSYADRCPCNPKNGGSGVCNCILGGPQVTCSVGDVNQQIRAGLAQAAGS